MPEFRAQKIGLKLMQELTRQCVCLGGAKIRWDVLSTNERAQNFYQSVGARWDQEWRLYSLSDNYIHNLANLGIL